MVPALAESIAVISTAAGAPVNIPSFFASSLGDVDSFNKVWGVLIAAFAVIFAAALGSLATALVQLRGANQQRKHEKKAAEDDSLETARLADNKLALLDAASQRKANAKVAQMRQVWINELRADTATYLALWQDIAYRWEAIIANPSSRAFASVSAESLNAPIAKMRQTAHELQLRIVMRLNPYEQKHTDLRCLMIKLEDTVKTFHRDKSSKSGDLILLEVIELIQNIIDKQQEILKEEWRVVKKELGLSQNNL